MVNIINGFVVYRKGNDTYIVDGMHYPFTYVHFENGKMVYPILSLSHAEQLEKLNGKYSI
jgi:hypothetical protein